MATIVKYEWDLGNGEVSNSPTPVATYFPGVYNVQLIATTSDGNTYVAYESKLIFVAEDQQNLLTEKYLTDPKSYHYGTNPSIASGWSRNSGDNWVWPESQASVSHQTVNGIDCLLVWDLYDDYQYLINPRNSAFSQVVHTDKGVFEISCSATFGGVMAESNSYEIMHQQTKIHLRKDIDTGTRPTGMSTYMSLIGEDGDILEKVKVVTGSEIIFKEQSVYANGEHESLQIKFETDKSGYQLTNFESIYKSNDKSNIAEIGTGTDTAAQISDVDSWITRTGTYAVDLANGNQTGISASFVSGPDGWVGSAANLTADLTVANSGVTGTLLFWYTGTKPDIGISLIDTIIINGYTLAYYVGAIPSSVTIPNGTTFFDFRIINGTLTEETIYDYGNNFNLHIGE